MRVAPHQSGNITRVYHACVRDPLYVLLFPSQYNALNSVLTVKEHLEFYALIRGSPRCQVTNIVNSLLSRMHLERFANQSAGRLSGGNKRKLCVGIALIGEPPVVLLDEPSSGVDAEARQFLWHVISASMEQRATILTSHAMDECEALCTRIGIMARGSFRCMGSVQELKKEYGEGYFLTVKVYPEEEANMATVVLQDMRRNSIVSHALLQDQYEGMMMFQLNIPGSELAGVFSTLEGLRGNNELPFQCSTARPTLLDYNVSQDSLERIFVCIAQHAAQEEHQEACGKVAQ